MFSQILRLRQSQKTKHLSPEGKEALDLIRAVVEPDTDSVLDFLKWLSPSQSQSISEVLTGYDKRPASERELIRYILRPLAKKETLPVALYETLLLHDFFIGRPARTENRLSFESFVRIIVGLRDNLDLPLDLSTRRKRTEVTALIEFIFAVEVSGSEFTTHFYNKSRGLGYVRYEKQALKELVIRYADDYQRLIEVATSRGTTNPELLALMMEEGSAAVLTEGVL